jgi:hypothetical protein
MKQKITRNFLIMLLLTAFLAGCGNKSDKATETTTPTDTTKPVANEPAVAATSNVKLICKELGEDSLNIPHFDVLLSADGKETKIKSINGCADIARTEYKTYEIPDTAIAACGGWYAGAGDYYYVILQDGKPVVFEGWQDESQQEKGYHWKQLKLK